MENNVLSDALSIIIYNKDDFEIPNLQNPMQYIYIYIYEYQLLKSSITLKSIKGSRQQ